MKMALFVAAILLALVPFVGSTRSGNGVQALAMVTDGR